MEKFEEYSLSILKFKDVHNYWSCLIKSHHLNCAWALTNKRCIPL